MVFANLEFDLSKEFQTTLSLHYCPYKINMGINAAIYSSKFISEPKIYAYRIAVARMASDCGVMQ